MVNMTPNLRFRQETGEEYPNWNMIEFERVFSTVPTSSYQIPSGEVLERGKYEVVDQGKRSIAGYSNDDAKVFSGVPAIVYGDHTTEVKFREEPFVVGADGTKILVSNIESSDLKYLYYALSKKNVAQEGYKRHFPILKTVFIPLPSLPEQKKIAEFFSLLDERISKQADKVASLQEYKRGLSQRIFSRELRFKDENGEDYPEWEEKKLGEVASIRKGFTPSTGRDDFWKGNIPWLSIAGFTGKYIDNGNKTISEKALGSKMLFPAGSLVMSFKLTIGKLAILNKAMMTNEAICVFDWKSNSISTEYAFYALSRLNFDKFVNQAVAGKTLNDDSLSTLPLPLPSLPEQEKIAALLSTMDSRIVKEEEKLEALHEQKRGLMQRMLI